jgi:hypothetical protein
VGSLSWSLGGRIPRFGDLARSSTSLLYFSTLASLLTSIASLISVDNQQEPLTTRAYHHGERNPSTSKERAAKTKTKTSTPQTPPPQASVILPSSSLFLLEIIPWPTN